MGKNEWKARVKEETIESGFGTREGGIKSCSKTIIMTAIPHERLHPH